MPNTIQNFPNGLTVRREGAQDPVWRVDKYGNMFVTTYSGATTFSGSGKIIIKNGIGGSLAVFNPSQLSGVGTIDFGADAGEGAYIYESPQAISMPATQSSFYRHWIASSNPISVPTGSNTVATLALAEPNLTLQGSLTTAATLYIGDAPTEATNNFGLLVDGGAAQFAERVLLKQAATDTVAANALTLGSANVFSISGTTAIQYITTTGWQAGSVIHLKFNSAAATIANNTTPVGLSATVLMGSAGTYTARANDVVTLILLSNGAATKAWYMTSGAL